MTPPSHITRYDQMPIPPVAEQTELFEAGAVVFGVEYRLLTDAIAAANELARAGGSDRGVVESLDDRGVSIHVFVEWDAGEDGGSAGERLEHLRFDCFDEDPHYHYISWKERSNEMLHIDPVADGDPVAWALERIRTRLPQMLARAGAQDAVRRLDPARIEAVLPRVVEAAYRARYHHDAAAVERAALRGGS